MAQPMLENFLKAMGVAFDEKWTAQVFIQSPTGTAME